MFSIFLVNFVFYLKGSTFCSNIKLAEKNLKLAKKIIGHILM